MLRGMATVSYFAADLPAAGRWYTELLGVEPYFEVPGAYLEFRIGDYQHELGLINSNFAPAGTSTDPAPAGEILYWHVDDLQDSLARLLSMGAPRAPAGDRTRPRVRHRVRHRSVREHPGHHDQPALPGGAGRPMNAATRRVERA